MPLSPPSITAWPGNHWVWRRHDPLWRTVPWSALALREADIRHLLAGGQVSSPLGILHLHNDTLCAAYHTGSTVLQAGWTPAWCEQLLALAAYPTLPFLEYRRYASGVVKLQTSAATLSEEDSLSDCLITLMDGVLLISEYAAGADFMIPFTECLPLLRGEPAKSLVYTQHFTPAFVSPARWEDSRLVFSEGYAAPRDFTPALCHRLLQPFCPTVEVL